MRIIIGLQGVYYVLTGVWPLFSMRTFEAVTGPKTDDWLVKMVGLLAATIGAALLLGSLRRPPHRETVLLAILGAASFAAIDIVYSLNGTISRIYLADAAIQAVVITGLLATWCMRRKNN